MKATFINILAVAFALGTGGPAMAQDRSSNGNTTGSAVPRGGDSGGSTAPRGGDSGGSSSSGSSSGGSGSSSGGSSGSSYIAPPSPTFNTFEAPRRSDDQSGGTRTRGGGSSSGGERAVPRGGGSSEPRGGSGSGGSTASSSGGGSADAPSRRAVPAYSRPRDGRPANGYAVERGSVPPPSGGGGGTIYYPYYPWGFWGPGYGYGLGYMFYDPWYGGGYGYGYPYGGGYGYGGYGGYSGGYGGSGGYQVSRGYRDTGNLRLKIDPKDAQVYVDGYYVGVIDSFDGTFQKLNLDSGGHKIELKAEGFQPLEFEVLITPGETVTYKGEMKRK